MKRILIVYYSRDGRNKKIAQDLQRQLKCDIEEIIDLKNRHGWLAWCIAGFDVSYHRPTKIKELAQNPADYDLVIIGAPIWVGDLPPAIYAFINQYQDSLGTVAFYQCFGGGGDDKALAKFKAEIGSPLAHFVIRKANLETEEYQRKIDAFVKKIKEL